MSTLPNFNNALLEREKLSGYCLSKNHPRGRHKARVFAEVLGLEEGDAEWLRGAILSGLVANEAVSQERDSFGQRWRVDMMLARQNRRAVIRTIWIILADETAPRFVTCWVL